jgi:hypothetical protein
MSFSTRCLDAGNLFSEVMLLTRCNAESQNSVDPGEPLDTTLNLLIDDIESTLNGGALNIAATDRGSQTIEQTA